MAPRNCSIGSRICFASITRRTAGTTGGKGWANLSVIDPNAGKALGLYQSGSAVMSVAYSPDGKVLVTGHSLGQIRAWDAEALRNP